MDIDVRKFQQDIKSISDSTFEKKINEMAHKSILGASIGGGIFIVYAWMKGRSAIVYGSIGAVLGGVIGYGVSKAQEDYNERNKEIVETETDDFYN